jgi:thiosulfate/3-mercaptopyruvate sulfurtransferase
MRPSLLARLAAVAILGAALSVHAQSGKLIVDQAYVRAALARGVIVWDVRPEAEYGQGHIPGAVNLGDAGSVLRNVNTEDFLPVPELEKLLGQAGIDPAKEVIVYGSRGNPYAYFGQYTIQYFGGREVRVFHDGIDGWRAAGQPVATTATRLAPIALHLTPAPAGTVSTGEVIARLKDPGVQIIDARTAKEFSGEDIRAIRGGHIPGAVNIPFEHNWVDPDAGGKLARKQVSNNAGMSLKPQSDLRALYAKLDPEKETVVYCQSGVRAAETAAVLSELGFKNVKVYDSSWLGYGNTLDAPADNAVFLNVGALNARLGAMQGRIESLEKELAAAKTAKTPQ